MEFVKGRGCGKSIPGLTNKNVNEFTWIIRLRASDTAPSFWNERWYGYFLIKECLPSFMSYCQPLKDYDKTI